MYLTWWAIPSSHFQIEGTVFSELRMFISSPGIDCVVSSPVFWEGVSRDAQAPRYQKKRSCANKQQTKKHTREAWIWAGVWGLPVFLPLWQVCCSLTCPGIVISLSVKKKKCMRLRNTELLPAWSCWRFSPSVIQLWGKIAPWTRALWGNCISLASSMNLVLLAGQGQKGT